MEFFKTIFGNKTKHFCNVTMFQRRDWVSAQPASRGGKRRISRAGMNRITNMSYDKKDVGTWKKESVRSNMSNQNLRPPSAFSSCQSGAAVRRGSVCSPQSAIYDPVAFLSSSAKQMLQELQKPWQSCVGELNRFQEDASRLNTWTQWRLSNGTTSVVQAVAQRATSQITTDKSTSPSYLATPESDLSIVAKLGRWRWSGRWSCSSHLRINLLDGQHICV